MTKELLLQIINILKEASSISMYGDSGYYGECAFCRAESYHHDTVHCKDCEGIELIKKLEELLREF